jgi:hypothetical protein
MLQRFESSLARMARRKWLALLVVGLAPLALRALLLPWLGEPDPRVQDEFSHLLVADTFAHGKLVNPVHPLWVHFESMHILVRPVYASVFPAAPGLLMAAGQVLTGHPWPGVWLAVGLMCAAVCWMLQGWVSPGWALLGGALAAVRFGVFSYWMNSYFGGAVAAAAGALVLGALPRVCRRRDWPSAAVMGAGLAILAHSRPYEGALLGVPAVAALIWMLWNRARRLRVLLPLLLVLGLAAAATLYYFARFSGNPFQLPYSLYRNSVTMAPHFIWQAPRPEPVYHHAVLRDFYTGWEMRCYHDARANRAPHGLFDKAKGYWRFYLGPFLTLPFVMLPWLWKRRRVRVLLAVGVWFALGLAVEVWHLPHYAAPALGLIVLLVILALRQLGQTAGAWPVRAVVLAALLSPVVGGSGTEPGTGDRARIRKHLESAGGRHLVLVRYSPGHDVGNEWVYNAADIDHAPVVWAREMDAESNRKLLGYFENRRAWLVEPDAPPITLEPYDPSRRPPPPFRFVKLGTEAIEVLRSPDEVRRRVQSRAATGNLSCDQWNYFFTQVTGVGPPDPAQGCFPPGQRGQPVTFEHWFGWLEKQ